MKSRIFYLWLAGMLLVTMLLVSCDTRNHPSKMIHVYANYSCAGDSGSAACTVYVRNDDTYDWHNVSLFVDELYKYAKNPLAVIKAGETFSAPLADFKIGDGPFDITKYKPVKIGVRCDEGSYFYGWSK